MIEKDIKTRGREKTWVKKLKRVLKKKGLDYGDAKRLIEKGEQEKLNIEEVTPSEIATSLLYNYDFVTLRDTEEIYVYDEGVYKEFGEALIKAETQKMVNVLGKGDKVTTHFVNEVVNRIKRETFESRSIFQGSPYKLNLKNSVLDLEPLKKGNEPYLMEHSPDWYFLNKLPVKYDPEADCPKIRKFLNEVTHEEDMETIQDLVGHTLIKDYLFAKLAILLGEGENGKSTFLRLLERFLGKRSVSSETLQRLAGNRFAPARLYGKMANICADLPSKPVRYMGVIKALTGGDLVPAEKKFKPGFDFENYAQLWFSCNQLPKIEEDTKAVWRRIMTIDFPNRFSENPEEYKNNENVKKADPNILDKITTEKELSGFLNFALEGVRRILDQGHITESKSHKEKRKEYILQSNPIKAFCENVLIAKPGAKITSDKLFRAFRRYCRKNSLPIKSKVAFSRKFQEHVTVEKCQISGERGWRGVQLPDEWVKEEKLDS